MQVIFYSGILFVYTILVELPPNKLRSVLCEELLWFGGGSFDQQLECAFLSVTQRMLSAEPGR